MFQECCKVEAEWQGEVERLGEVEGQLETSGKSIRPKLHQFLGETIFVGKNVF